MKLQRKFALLLASAISLTAIILPVRAEEGDTVPFMQKQEDFMYEESIDNQDDTQFRKRSNIDLNWRFHLGDVAGAEEQGFDADSWRLLNLPHDWSIEGEYKESNPSGPSCGYLPGGIGWYRKTLTVPREWRDGKKISLEFDGVFRNSKVYVNGNLLGGAALWLDFLCLRHH